MIQDQLPLPPTHTHRMCSRGAVGNRKEAARPSLQLSRSRRYQRETWWVGSPTPAALTITTNSQMLSGLNTRCIKDGSGLLNAAGVCSIQGVTSEVGHRLVPVWFFGLKHPTKTQIGNSSFEQAEKTEHRIFHFIVTY